MPFLYCNLTQSMQSLRNLLGSNEGEPTSEAGAYEHHGTLKRSKNQNAASHTFVYNPDQDPD